jgi:hypothetical protein
VSIVSLSGLKINLSVNWYFWSVKTLKGLLLCFFDGTGNIFFKINISFDVGLDQKLVCKILYHSLSLFFLNNYSNYEKWPKIKKCLCFSLKLSWKYYKHKIFNSFLWIFLNYLYCSIPVYVDSFIWPFSCLNVEFCLEAWTVSATFSILSFLTFWNSVFLYLMFLVLSGIPLM